MLEIKYYIQRQMCVYARTLTVSGDSLFLNTSRLPAVTMSDGRAFHIRVRSGKKLCLFALCTNFSERGSHCIVMSLLANTYFLIKLDRVSCTNYFMSIHNLRYSVQLIQIATRNKTNLWKIPRFWRFNQLCTRHSYVCRHGLYVVYIVTQTPSFRRSRDLDKSNTFGQMKELTNDYYSEIKLHNIFHAIEFSTTKKEPTISFPIPILERQRGSHWSWPPMADSCIRRIGHSPCIWHTELGCIAFPRTIRLQMISSRDVYEIVGDAKLHHPTGLCSSFMQSIPTDLLEHSSDATGAYRVKFTSPVSTRLSLRNLCLEVTLCARRWSSIAGLRKGCRIHGRTAKEDVIPRNAIVCIQTKQYQ